MTMTTLLASAALSFAAFDSGISGLVDNAIQVDTAAGSYVTYFNLDGSYTTTVGITGTWRIEGDQLCIERSTGEGGCQPLQAELELGDTWTGTNSATGETVTYTIIARE
jgi:hypothetical protein